MAIHLEAIWCEHPGVLDVEVVTACRERPEGQDDCSMRTSMKLIPVGGGMYGLPETDSRLVFKSLVRLLVAQGYQNDNINTKNDNPLEFVIGETYLMSHKEKGRNIYIGLPPAAGTASNIYINLVIARYADPKEVDYSKSGF